MSGPLTGLRAWLIQRVSAVALGLTSLYLAYSLFLEPVGDAGAWRARVGSAAVAAGLFFAGLLLHAWVGVRDVLLDYVRAPWLRLLALALLAVVLVAQALWVATVLVRAL